MGPYDLLVNVLGALDSQKRHGYAKKEQISCMWLFGLL